MRPAKQDQAHQPTLVSSSVDSHERRVVFAGGTGIELQYPARLVWPSPWIGHIPFALWLVEALRPRVLVELGVHSGNSYCAFLQGVQSLGLTAQCHGIDHWRGDEHADHYSDDVYAELCAYHDPLYGTFSTLLRATFEEALPYFSDRSIDLLHIDGFHTYDAVAKDFSDWLPKMSARGVVLFHDINVRERDFGVWRFWEEIAERYPTQAFVHSHGLGLAYVGSEPPPASLRTLLAASDPDAIGRIRSYFARLGTSLVDRFARRQAEDIASRVRASEAELDATRAELRRQVEAADSYRLELGNATARVALLEDELTRTKADIAYQIEGAAKLQRELSASRAEAARQAEAAARLQQELFSASRAEASRQAEAVAALEQELSASRAEAARQTESIGALQQQCAAARSELARLSDAARLSRMDTKKATERIALLTEELAAARAEIGPQRSTADATRGSSEERTAQVAALEEQLRRARDQTSEAFAQRERATQLLRQQIATTAALQREVAGFRQNPALTALVNRLATFRHVIPAPVKRYIKNRLLGLRP